MEAKNSKGIIENSVAEPHHFNRAPAPENFFDEAPAPTLLYTKITLKKVNLRFVAILPIIFYEYKSL
jgi:hypothetical protein